MDQLVNIPWNVRPTHIAEATLQAFRPLLEGNRAQITSVAKKTFKFGETDRHCLDIYWPPTLASSGGETPILFYVYGGGFVSGSRNYPPPHELVYSCLGAFFAKQGFITVIADYRLAPEVKYPTPVEDVRDAIQWVLSHKSELVTATTPNPDLDSLIVAGHSAGAVHAATLILHPTILPLESDIRKRIKGVVLMSGPYHIPTVREGGVLEMYWGTEEYARSQSSLSLLLNWFDTRPRDSLPKILLVEAQYEPEWMFNIGVDVQRVLEWHLDKPIKMVVGKRHNHISLFCALSSGEGEEWGVETADWMWKVLRGTDGANAEADILKDVKETDEHECSGCHQKRSRSFTVELRTRSVSSKTFISCLNCGNKWTRV